MGRRCEGIRRPRRLEGVGDSRRSFPGILHLRVEVLDNEPHVAAQISTQGGHIIGASPQDFAGFRVKVTRTWGGLVRNAHVKPG